MVANIIDGRALAQHLTKQLAGKLNQLRSLGARPPGLAVIMVGQDPASEIYVARKCQACQELRMLSRRYNLPATTSTKELLALVATLNLDPVIDGILIQLPLPAHLDTPKILEAVAPDKDVDGFHPYNIGRLAIGAPLLRSCTPKGIMTMLHHIEFAFSGKHAVIIGASNIVGKPMALELVNRACTVTICNKATTNLAAMVAQADLLISATGVPELVSGAWLQPGVVVIDVGISRLPNGQVVGDVEFAKAQAKASWITPVPGGVGPMTVVTLMENTWEAATTFHGLGHAS